MPEPGGLALDTAARTIRALAAAMPVVGFGPTEITLANGDAERPRTWCHADRSRARSSRG
jgi:hypothetical protein